MTVGTVASVFFVCAGMVLCLRFQGCVQDAHSAQFPLYFADCGFRIGRWSDDDVCGQGGFGCTDRPDVQMVYAAYSGRGFHLLPYRIGIYVFRHGIHAHPDAFREQFPCAY